ncbi:MAG: sulfite exporter TauE/SafE family protein [Acidobacteria bacterium]|nr:sulfite exporter TauE/SafE family protein [Acidobacteriota bacterium]
MIAALFVALGILTIAFVAVWFTEARKHPDMPDPGAPDAERIAVGFFANFFDALGIGSFATTTTYVRLRKLVADELIPGTLNVGHCLPTITQAFIGIAIIEVDVPTLVLMIAAAVAGSWYGAGVVAKMPRRAIQVGMGVALLIAAGFMFAKATGVMPSGGETLGLSGVGWAIGLVGSFFLGSIMPLGIGYYAPAMILISMLGMSPRAAFPIMMGACAFLMPVAGMQFVRKQRHSHRASVGLAIGGVFGSALALLVIKELDLKKVTWLVFVVVIYTGISLLRTAAREKAATTKA